MLGNWGHSTRRGARNSLRREAVAAFCVFVLLLNTLAGFLSHSHYAAADGLALPVNGSKMVICSGTQMFFVDKDGNVIPGEQRQRPDLECACCLLMQAHAVMPPPPSNPEPLQLAAIQVLRPGDARHLGAEAALTRRNRGPPSQA
jgi:hypothetical protein